MRVRHSSGHEEAKISVEFHVFITDSDGIACAFFDDLLEKYRLQGRVQFFPIFSIRNHLPFMMTVPRLRMMFQSDALQSLMPSSCSLPSFLIKLLAWLCWSIIRLRRLAFSMIIPFSIETASLGRPATFYYCICTGSQKGPSHSHAFS